MPTSIVSQGLLAYLQTRITFLKLFRWTPLLAAVYLSWEYQDVWQWVIRIGAGWILFGYFSVELKQVKRLLSDFYDYAEALEGTYQKYGHVYIESQKNKGDN